MRRTREMWIMRVGGRRWDDGEDSKEKDQDWNEAPTHEDPPRREEGDAEDDGDATEHTGTRS